MSEDIKKIIYDVYTQAKEHYGWSIYCSGCKRSHEIDKRWSFNGDYVKPTFRASLLCKWDMSKHGLPNKVCHSFITDGKIQYLDDCTHELKGTTVDLEAF